MLLREPVFFLFSAISFGSGSVFFLLIALCLWLFPLTGRGAFCPYPVADSRSFPRYSSGVRVFATFPVPHSSPSLSSFRKTECLAGCLFGSQAAIYRHSFCRNFCVDGILKGLTSSFVSSCHRALRSSIANFAHFLIRKGLG